VNGQRVSSMDDLRSALWGTGGRQVPVVVTRPDGTAHTLTVTPDAQQPEDVEVPPTHV
jgi:S1-C subfamily serine protease